MSTAGSDISIQDALNILQGITFSATTIGELATIFQYMGFDPRIIIGIMSNRAKTNSRDLNTDVISCTTLFLARGTKIATKLQAKTSAKGVTMIQQLVQVYQIQETKKGNSASSYKPDTLTLGRIAAAFAPVTCLALDTGKIPRIVGEKPEKLPLGLAWSGGASMIPRQETYNDTYEAWINWALSFDKVVNPDETGKTKTSDEDRLKGIRKFGDIMRGATFFSDSYRAQLIAKLKA